MGDDPTMSESGEDSICIVHDGWAHQWEGVQGPHGSGSRRERRLCTSPLRPLFTRLVVRKEGRTRTGRGPGSRRAGSQIHSTGADTPCKEAAPRHPNTAPGGMQSPLILDAALLENTSSWRVDRWLPALSCCPEHFKNWGATPSSLGYY